MPSDLATDSAPLSPLQESVAQALGSGATISGAAEDAGISRVTVYRWMKTSAGFPAAIQKARAEFLLSRRDDLHYLSNRALETLLAVLDNPRSSPSVLLRAASFILQRPHEITKGWSLPEPLPAIDCDTLTDSALLEKECARLACIDNLEPDEIDESAVPDADADGPDDTGSNVTECNEMGQEEEIYDDAPLILATIAHREGGMPSCPIPTTVLRGRETRIRYLDAVDEFTALEKMDRRGPETQRDA